MNVTLEDQRCVARWRGLREHVLLEFNALDQAVLDRGGNRFEGPRREAIESRLRALKLRELYGLDHMTKLRATG